MLVPKQDRHDKFFGHRQITAADQQMQQVEINLACRHEIVADADAMLIQVQHKRFASNDAVSLFFNRKKFHATLRYNPCVH